MKTLRLPLAGLAATVVLLLLATLAVGENWSRFRGPNGTGHGGDLPFPDEWEDNAYLWSRDLPGRGHSSPVGWEDRIFVTSGNEETAEMLLLALSADTGDEIWRTPFAGAVRAIHGGNSYASTTPAIDAERIFLTFFGPEETTVAAVDHQGSKIWEQPIGKFHGNHGFASSPVIAGGVVCVQLDQEQDGALFGLDAQTGAIRWKVSREAAKESYATPCLIQTVVNGEPRLAVIDSSTAGGMRAVEAATGDVLWQAADAYPVRCVSSPVPVGEGLVLGACGGGGGGVQLVAVEHNRQPTNPPKMRWELRREVPYVPCPLSDGRRVYLWQDRGVVACVDLESGDLLWKNRVGGNFFSSPILVGGKIYSISRDGEVVVLAATDKFQVLGRHALGEATHATPAIHAGRMYLRTETHLWCLPTLDRQATAADESDSTSPTDAG